MSRGNECKCTRCNLLNTLKWDDDTHAHVKNELIGQENSQSSSVLSFGVHTNHYEYTRRMIKFKVPSDEKVSTANEIGCRVVEQVAVWQCVGCNGRLRIKFESGKRHSYDRVTLFCSFLFRRDKTVAPLWLCRCQRLSLLRRSGWVRTTSEKD